MSPSTLVGGSIEALRHTLSLVDDGLAPPEHPSPARFRGLLAELRHRRVGVIALRQVRQSCSIVAELEAATERHPPSSPPEAAVSTCVGFLRGVSRTCLRVSPAC